MLHSAMHAGFTKVTMRAGPSAKFTTLSAKSIVPILFVAGIWILIFTKPATLYPQTPGKPAIARLWQGRTSIAKADAFEKYLQQVGVHQMTSASGNLGIQIFRRPTPEAVEFIVLSYWESRDAITKVVGEDIERAFALPREPEFLLEPVTVVRYYQVVLSQYQ